MSTPDLAAFTEKVFDQIEKIFPEYLANPEDYAISTGNLGICIIDASGHIYGRIIGPNKIRGRELFRVAWVKSSQVWITGLKTVEYEKRVYAGTIDESKFGISRPDLIGWEGGQPFTLKDGTNLSVGVSGIRGIYDLEIAARAVKAVEG